MTQRKISLSIVIILGILLLVTACTPVEQQPTDGSSEGATGEVITIGFMAPMSGDAASYGLSILRGAQLAVKDAGLQNVKLVTEDSRCEGKNAVSAINKLISVDKVQVIIGEVCSGATLAAAPIAAQNGVVMVSPSSTSPEITNEAFVYRTVPSDALQGAFGAELAASRGYKTMAILHGNEDYGIGFREVLIKEFPKQGGKVVAAEAFERGAVDVRTQLTKIKNAKPEVIYLISNSPDSGVAALKQMKELGIEAAIIGSEGLKGQDILEGAGTTAEGIIITAVSGGNAEFIQKHIAEYGEEPGPFAAQGYDAFKAVAETIKMGAKDKSSIKAKLASVQFVGASGDIKFDANGDVAGNYDVFVVKEGKFVQE